MRTRIEIHPGRVTVPSRSTYALNKEVVEISRSWLEELTQVYPIEDIVDGVAALRLIGSNPHYWTTPMEIAKKITEGSGPLHIVWLAEDQDENLFWDSMDVYSLHRNEHGGIWFVEDTEGVHDENWLKMAVNRFAFYEHHPIYEQILVIEPHPTLF